MEQQAVKMILNCKIITLKNVCNMKQILKITFAPKMMIAEVIEFVNMITNQKIDTVEDSIIVNPQLIIVLL